MQTHLEFSFDNEKGIELMEGEAEASLDKDKLSLRTISGNNVRVKYGDIRKINDLNHQIQLKLASGRTLNLSKLGYSYKRFYKNITEKRNEKIIKLLLLNESLKGKFEGDFEYSDEETDSTKSDQDSEIRLYETSLVLVPKNIDPIKLPYGDISEIIKGDYVFTIKTSVGEELKIKKLGRSHKEFERKLDSLLGKLTKNIRSELEKLVESDHRIDEVNLIEVSRLMKDGRAVKKSEIKNISKKVWRSIENSLDKIDIKKEYEFLISLSELNDVYVGVKRGLMGDLTNQYVWFLIPVVDNKRDQPRNAVFMEGSSVSKSGGKATYAFKVSQKEEVLCNKEDKLKLLKERNKDFIQKVNRCMMDINFRREPIYLTEDKLDDEKYSKYKFAIQNIPSLRFLRKHYIGRVIHRSKEQWRRGIRNILDKATV